MEYPGCIFFKEDLFEDNPSLDIMTSIGKTICHEIAHMWFGNLVAIKWWDETWLKESFADFMAFRMLEGI